MSLLSTRLNNLFSGFTKEQISLFRKFNTPARVQDFLETLGANFGNTSHSPKKVLEKKKAHCFEGALLAAAILRFHGRPPLLVDLKVADGDDDHVVAVFRENGHWGAIGKTNHAVLRFRDPVYKSIRELVMSFFNEYFLENGRKTLRSYSAPINLSKFDKSGWMTSEKKLDYIADFIDKVPHKKILDKKMISNLRKADPFERKILNFVQWKK
ncbi:MAG: hypothetical protein HYS78_01935 [Parcubacteria group bacterium]|nr:hypothetical protein [Parcubacteria group bacterium]